MHSDLLPKNTVWKGEKNKEQLNSGETWLMLISTVISYINSMYSWYDMMKITIYLCGLSHKTHNPNLITRQSIDKFHLRNILQNTWPVPQNRQESGELSLHFTGPWPLWSGQSHTPEGDVDMSKKALHSARPLEAQGLSQGHTCPGLRRYCSPCWGELQHSSPHFIPQRGRRIWNHLLNKKFKENN